MSVPDSIDESEKIDGANDFVILFKIMIPLIMPIISVIALFYSVGHWNGWFDALIYIRSRDRYPLQLVLREILIQNDTSSMMTDVSDTARGAVSELIKYATVIVATLPIVCVYHMLQKYFVKGVLIGSVKG
jgi:putative aldouronate transport system permease protein